MKMSDELFERFIGRMTEVHLKNREILIPYYKLDQNLYVSTSGIIRACYFDGQNEKTYGFAIPGTLTLSYHSHYLRKPSIFQFESCGESTVLRLSKTDLNELLGSSLEFANWMVAVQSAQLCAIEYKFTSINGSPKERYLWLLKNRPEILGRIPQKILASYLGVTHTHMSHLKRAWQEEK